MVSTILLKLLLFLAVFELASAIAGHRVYGTRFSLALPRITTVSRNTKYIGSLYLATEEERSTVKIYYPKNAIDQTKGYIAKPGTHLKRNTPVEKFIPTSHLFPRNSGTGVYNTVKIISTSPIRVILNRYNNKNQDSADSHNVMPLESCSTSFYVSTGLGGAFLMVMTFDDIVKIKVTFPKTGQKFDFLCHPETRCKDDASGMLTLRRNKAWYVEQERASRFLNTLIETDKPVFVIAGNKAFNLEGRSLNDLLVTSIYPTDAWGKEYIVPRFASMFSIKRNIILQFNVKKLPFKFKSYKRYPYKSKGYTSHVLSSFDSYFTLRDSIGFTTITADVPFGLYQIFGLPNQSDERDNCVGTIVNLIPTEQWSNGFVIRKPKDKRYVIKLFMLEKDTRQRWVLTGTGQNSVRWESQKITNLKNRRYLAGRIKTTRGSATFFNKDPTTRMLAYQFKQSKSYSSCSGVPLDFYQARIHQTDCEKQKTVASDGVDNDCDGRVDEEIKDEKDNDDDGEVDEDLVEPVGHGGEWMPWEYYCVSNTGSTKSPTRVRSCRLTRLGRGCHGPDTQYSLGKCGGLKTWSCPESCQKCKPGHAMCEECLAGYYDDRFCLRPCPPGWVGKGCSDLNPKIHPAKVWVINKTTTTTTTSPTPTTTPTTTTTISTATATTTPIFDDGSDEESGSFNFNKDCGNSNDASGGSNGDSGCVNDTGDDSTESPSSNEDDDEYDVLFLFLPSCLILLGLVSLVAVRYQFESSSRKQPVIRQEETVVVVQDEDNEESVGTPV